ncbi:hypothetical protein AN219_20015 [Streptomyces nanshensis]|nr:hypothetical protein AN219_20015 [Streptomyces nanshensis]
MAVEPAEAVAGETDERLSRQGAVRLRRPCQFGAFPLVRRRRGVRLGADVDQRQRELAAGLQVRRLFPVQPTGMPLVVPFAVAFAARPGVRFPLCGGVLRDAQAQRLALRRHRAHRVLEQDGVQRAAYLDDFGDARPGPSGGCPRAAPGLPPGR